MVLFLGTYFAQADNCHATKTGTFTFQVEEAIGLSGSVADIDLGAICPSCTKTFKDKCFEWTLTGGKTCVFEAVFTNPTIPTGITVDDDWYVNTNAAWDPIQSTNLYNIYANSQFAAFKICVNSIYADCNVASGPKTLTYGLAVNYTCTTQQGAN